MQAQEQAARATRGMPSPIIKDISVTTCQPAGVRLIVAKITTDQDGLYGYGCATFTQRADLVVPAVERYKNGNRPFGSCHEKRPPGGGLFSTDSAE
jgi:mannonate dehydratase